MPQTPSKFCLTRADEGEFLPLTGLRDWLKIRDLGLRNATGGQYDAWITRAAQLDGSTGRHYHNYDFQIMFITQGWVKMYYEGEGEGEFTLRAGDFVYHPKQHVHDFMEYSPDIEIFELTSPAHHHSIDV